MMASPATVVVKIGGRFAEEETLIRHLADEFRLRAGGGERHLLVHGGGVTISALQERRGVKPVFQDGLRQTPPEEMDLVDMALIGAVNTRLVRLCRSAGLDAWGLSGCDGGLLSAVSATGDPEENRTGSVTAVDTAPLESLWRSGHFPVFAPPAMDASGNGLNINADQAALAVAAALKASALIFISDVPGVLEGNQVVGRIDEISAEDLKAREVIKGGMIPKVDSALDALRRGVGAVIIGDYADSGDLEKLLSGRRGTRIEISGGHV